MSPPTRQVFVHVGCPKTGTTFLQSTLWRSRDALQAEGVELPLDRVSHFHLALAVREQLDPQFDPKRAFRVMDRLAAALDETTAPTVLLSHEVLAGATAEQAERLWSLLRRSLPDAEPQLVVTARDLARQVPAEWQQQIQHRRTITWPEFLQSLRDGTEPAAYFLPAQDAASVARRWAADLPADRVHVVTVPRPGAPRDLLLERFCAVLGVDMTTVAQSVSVANESLGRVPLELLRRVNTALGERLPHPRAGFGRVGKRYLAQQVLAPMGGDRPALPADMASWCGEHSDRLIGELRTAGYEVLGDLEELRPDLGRLEAAPRDVTEAEIASLAVDALADLLDQRSRDLDQIENLRERVRELRGRDRRSR
ncbi:MAG: hypothetical protein ACRDQD_04470 [Nocardioidaceae bacterium]